MKTTPFRRAIPLSLALLAAGCGYRMGFPRPAGARTVAVRAFENDTFRRGVELDLTEEIGKQIVERTGLLLAPAERADAVLSGKVVDVVDQVLLEGKNREVREAAVWITVEATLADRRTGRAISALKIQDRAEYVTDNDQNRDTATRKAVGRLAEKIVLALCIEKG